MLAPVSLESCPSSKFEGLHTITYRVENHRFGCLEKSGQRFVPEEGVFWFDKVAKWFHKEHEREMPEGLFENEDKDKDGFISWDEFGGPKGSSPPKQEL